ncbi:MAG TPA: recombination mediator RecR [Phycisphaerales bacterium]|nr:recombination mediator RecR [Phycisphaerales bacterium]HMP37671.1 recombination mediator RecR [Phycisphaerales bacterium]
MSGAYPATVERLIEEFSSLPGIGRRSAERLAFHVLKSTSDEALALARAIADVKERVRHCSICWNLADGDPCPICADPARDAATILVVEQPKDLIVLEQTGMYRGVYHVLLGRIAPLDGVGVEALTVESLCARVRDPSANCRGAAVTEVILGLNPDLEGDSTALRVAELLREAAAGRGLRVTRLARGLPSGSQLEYANKAVLADAIEGRR